MICISWETGGAAMEFNWTAAKGKNAFQSLRIATVILHKCLSYYTPPHNSGGVLWFHVGRPCACLSIQPSVSHPCVFAFRMITWVNVNGFSPNLVSALILWRSGLDLIMGKFRQMFSSPEQKLRVSCCHHPLSVVHRRPSSVVCRQQLVC